MLLLFTCLFILKFLIQKKNYVLATQAVMMFTRNFTENISEGIGVFDKQVFNFVVTAFLFTLSCNLSGNIPGIEESTTDINTALAIGIACFLFVQYQGVKYKGVEYFKKFFSPIFIFFPLNVIGQSAKIASLSFRLFGNVLGGSIIMGLLFGVLNDIKIFYLPILAASLLYIFFAQKNIHLQNNKLYKAALGIGLFLCGLQFYFGIFHGLVQAMIVALLTNMYVASERSADGGH